MTRTSPTLRSLDTGDHRPWHAGTTGAALRLVAWVLVLVSVCVACGSTSAKRAVQPLVKTGSVTFAQLPRYQGSTPVGHPNVDGSAMTQTFSVNGTSPAKVLAFYAHELERWSVVEKPRALTAGKQSAWRGRWSSGTTTLIVSSEATPSPNQESLQYSLDLRRT